MLNDRENVITALRVRPMKIFDVMKRANIANQEVCQSLLLKMRDEGSVKFDIRKGVWSATS
ncbi:MAG: hypothetical protein JWQ94_29 [Tardiphaga sp.]|jgi:hypothetical protein|nr:hypothetical protein [Tardiphaga sp.]